VTAVLDSISHQNLLPKYQSLSPCLKHFVDSVLLEPGIADAGVPCTKRGAAYLMKP
jgi:hypothetical protein